MGGFLGHEIVGRIAQIKEKYSNEFPIGTYVSMAPAKDVETADVVRDLPICVM